MSVSKADGDDGGGDERSDEGADHGKKSVGEMMEDGKPARATLALALFIHRAAPVAGCLLRYIHMGAISAYVRISCTRSILISVDSSVCRPGSGSFPQLDSLQEHSGIKQKKGEWVVKERVVTTNYV